ncbi:MAG: AAA family ATPase, partial [Candidimonas sp.]
MKIIEKNAYVLMIGPSGAGKSTFSRTLFSESEIISTDDLREKICGDFRRQDVTDDTYDLLFSLAEMRLKWGQRVVIDATNLKQKDRESHIALAKKYGVQLVYLIFNRPINEKRKTAGWRHEVVVRGKPLIEMHEEQFRSDEKIILSGDKGLADLVIDARSDVLNETYMVVPSSIDEKYIRDNFNGIAIIGDIHSEYDRFVLAVDEAIAENLFIISLGDIIDYGSKPVETFRLINNLINRGQALAIMGNHEWKVVRYMRKIAECIEYGYGRDRNMLSLRLS